MDSNTGSTQSAESAESAEDKATTQDKAMSANMPAKGNSIRGLVSVLVVTRQNAEGLIDLVASILPQLSDNDEILIMVTSPSANVPSDMTQEVAGEIARQVECVRVFVADDLDEAYLFELALRSCKGSHIFLAEPGDIWLPDKVEKVLDVFRVSGSAVLLHNIQLDCKDQEDHQSSLFQVYANTSGLDIRILEEFPIGSGMALLATFRDFFLPFPNDISRFDQWMVMIAERFGGVVLETKPLIKKIMMEPGLVVPGATSINRQHREEQRRLTKAVKQRERMLSAALHSIGVNE